MMIPGWEHAIAEITSLYHGAQHVYRELPTGLRLVITPILVLLKYLPPIYLLERWTGGKTTQYKSAGFRQDLLYWFVYSGGTYGALQSTFVVTALAPSLKMFKLNLLGYFLPPGHYILHGLIYFVFADFLMYWWHRLEHGNRFLWAFHTTHHAQKNLSFITVNRFHPIEDLMLTAFTYVPLLMVGVSTQELIVVIWLYRFVAYLQHSQVQWSFGPLGKILVSPHFHAFHHSTDPAYYNCNFGATLSVWDWLFGTAVLAPERPTSYGLPDVEMPTLFSTLYLPFRMIYRTYLRRERVQPAGD